jgi:hypothetical protein
MPAPRWIPLLGLLAAACNGEAPAPKAAESADLAPGVIARVGEDDISAELAARVAVAQGISPAAARERLVQDALFAAHARATLRETGRIASAERSALARVLLEDLRKEVEAEGPPTDAEVAELTAVRWLDFDRPALVRTAHVVVLDDAETKSDKTRRVAERLRAALADAKDVAALEKAVKSVDLEGAETKVESLSPVAADGRIGDPAAPPGTDAGRLEESYARGAHAVSTTPGVSDVVATRYGLHVILALERIPEKRVPVHERRAVLAREVLDLRARKRHQAVLQAVNAAQPVQIDRSVGDSLMRVQVAR